MAIDNAERRRIIVDLAVVPLIDLAGEAERRVAFLRRLLAGSGARALILGISGGVDSALAGMLCRMATQRAAGCRFVAVRLPYGLQRDDADATLVVDTVVPDSVFTVDVKPASDAALATLVAAGLSFADEAQRDFVLGNIKARQRMVAQYAIAGTLGGLVVGTDHAAEAVTGFFTKYGDGGVDANPLHGLTKRQVRALAAHLGLPPQIVDKVPTADLEDLRPGLADEQVLGLTYEQIDDFLEGRPTDPAVADKVIGLYRATGHKRATPLTP